MNGKKPGAAVVTAAAPKVDLGLAGRAENLRLVDHHNFEGKIAS